MNMLEASGISKHFGGLVALDDVSLAVRPKEIYALIGPNGAGKTTLFNVLTGIYPPDKGSFTLDRKLMQGKKAHEMAKAGIARTFQNIRLFPEMTALENVMVGRHSRTKSGIFGAVFRNLATRNEENAVGKRAHELLDYVGIASHSRMLAKNLSYGDQRRLEIARALATDPKILALDEPAAGMNATETNSLKILLEKIRDDGISIVLIEHDVKLVMGLCDRVSVLNFGKKIAEGTPDEIKNDPVVIEAYLGAA